MTTNPADHTLLLVGERNVAHPWPVKVINFQNHLKKDQLQALAKRNPSGPRTATVEAYFPEKSCGLPCRATIVFALIQRQ